MSGPKRNPDKLNTIGVVVVGICGAVLVYVTIVALQAFYVNDTSEIQTMADYGGQDTTAKGHKADEMRNITEAGKNAVQAGQEATFRIPITTAMQRVIEDAKKDPSHLIPALPPSTKPSIEPIFGRPKAAAPAPAGGAGSAAPAGAGSAAPGAATPEPGAAAGSAVPMTPTGAPSGPQPVAGATGAPAGGAPSTGTPVKTNAPPVNDARNPAKSAPETGAQPKADAKAPKTDTKAGADKAKGGEAKPQPKAGEAKATDAKAGSAQPKQP